MQAWSVQSMSLAVATGVMSGMHRIGKRLLNGIPSWIGGGFRSMHRISLIDMTGGAAKEKRGRQ